MDEPSRQHAIYLYDRFTHEGMERRTFMAEMVKLAGTVAAAELLIAGIAASPAAAAIVPESDPPLFINQIVFGSGRDPSYTAYAATAHKGPAKRPTVLVIHENRGLNAHIQDIARR